MDAANRPKPETLLGLGEWGLLALLQPLLRQQTAGLPLPTGDDVAITEAPHGSPRLALTIDSMIEGTHFRWWDHPEATAEALGWKLAASNVSDLASKGAAPRFGLLSLGVPGDARTDRLEGFVRGLTDACHRWDFRLLGGDTVSAPQWTLTLALIGTLEAGLPIAARHAARPGDRLYVTGRPGEAAAGLDVLEGRLALSGEHAAALLRRALRPEPPVDFGRAIVAASERLAMIDVSDGVAKDAEHVSRQSSARLVLREEALPVSPALAAAAAAAGKPASNYILHGGEDYQLLLASPLPEERVLAIAAECGTGIAPIGRVEEGEGVWLEAEDGTLRPINREGYEHFK